MQRNLLYTYRPCMICIDISVSDMHTTRSGMHIVCVRYAYTFIVCISTQTICIHIYCMHIRHRRYAYQVLSALVCISDMDDCPLYRYRLCPICIPEQVVCISDTDDICIMDNCPCLICIPGQIVLGTHIIHVQYAYYLLWYAYRLCPICAPRPHSAPDTDHSSGV